MVNKTPLIQNNKNPNYCLSNNKKTNYQKNSKKNDSKDKL